MSSVRRLFCNKEMFYQASRNIFGVIRKTLIYCVQGVTGPGNREMSWNFLRPGDNRKINMYFLTGLVHSLCRKIATLT